MEMASSSQANSARFKSHLMLALCSVLLVQSCSSAPEAGKAFLDAQTIYDRWQANYGGIKSMKFRLSEATGFLDESGTPTYSMWEHWEKIEDGKRMYVQFSNRERGFADANGVAVNAFDGEVDKEYMPGLKEGSIHRGLIGRTQETQNPMRACLDGGWVNVSAIRPDAEENKRKLVADLMASFPEGIPLFTFHFMMSRHAGQIKVLPELESVAGQMCHVLEMGDSEAGRFTKFWLAHEKGMLLMRYVNQDGPEHYSKMEVAEVASVETDLGQVWYPRLVIRENNPGGKSRRHELRVHEFIPHIKVAPETFDIDFPPGTKVFDRVSNVSYTVGQ